MEFDLLEPNLGICKRQLDGFLQQDAPPHQVVERFLWDTKHVWGYSYAGIGCIIEVIAEGGTHFENTDYNCDIGNGEIYQKTLCHQVETLALSRWE
jgi:hypothetical protein